MTIAAVAIGCQVPVNHPVLIFKRARRDNITSITHLLTYVTKTSLTKKNRLSCLLSDSLTHSRGAEEVEMRSE